jgi:hypothetical protein
MKTVKEKDRIKILYIIFFIILFLEMLGTIAGFFVSSASTRAASFSNAFLIILTTTALIVPWVIEVKYKVDIPDVLEFVVLFMLFIAVVLGFLYGFYENVQGFDKFTHTLSGITLSLISFQVIVFLNRYEKVSLTMGAGITAVFSYALSVTLLVIWEIYEFAVDTISYMINTNIVSNMQKYLWVNTSSIFPQDYGLVDTMIDLILGCIGALVVCIVGFLIIRKQEIYSKDTA